MKSEIIVVIILTVVFIGSIIWMRSKSSANHPGGQSQPTDQKTDKLQK